MEGKKDLVNHSIICGLIHEAKNAKNETDYEEFIYTYGGYYYMDTCIELAGNKELSRYYKIKICKYIYYHYIIKLIPIILLLVVLEINLSVREHYMYMHDDPWCINGTVP